jgi:hypothetical protein
MTKLKAQIKELNCSTNQELIRDATDQEIAQMATDAADELAVKAEVEAKTIARAALLERLGITAEEAALLLG